MRKWLFSAVIMTAINFSNLSAHCQMPCGIYHDDMVYDQIDQYVETMVKGVAKLKENKFSTPQEKNECIRWVMTKDHLSDDIAQLITTFFLQQKIKPDEDDTAKRLESAHRMLVSLVLIKQTVDFKSVSEFSDEWEKFKLMFHVEGYACAIEKRNIKKIEDKQKEIEEKAKAEKQNETNGNSKAAPALKENSAVQSKGVKSGS